MTQHIITTNRLVNHRQQTNITGQGPKTNVEMTGATDRTDQAGDAEHVTSGKYENDSSEEEDSLDDALEAKEEFPCTHLIKAHPTLVLFECRFKSCDLTFTTTEERQAHYDTFAQEHATNETLRASRVPGFYKCPADSCKKDFDTKDQLRSHISSKHVDLGKFNCHHKECWNIR
ncbi:hypothetical protein BG000_008343 [Podila horticola]|nr:hypothetical protein BG000_008343 [Podila horticola]